MGGVILAQGREHEQIISGAIPGGAISIGLAGADGIYAEGDHLFVSEAGGSEVEFLGRVEAVSPALVSWGLPVRRAKDSGARLWRARHALATRAESALPFQSRVKTGVEIERSLGGVTYAIRVAAPVETIDWTLMGLTPQEEGAVVEFLAIATGGGELPFTIILPSRSLTAVQLASGEFGRAEGVGGRRSLRMKLLVEEDGGYR